MLSRAYLAHVCSLILLYHTPDWRRGVRGGVYQVNERERERVRDRDKRRTHSPARREPSVPMLKAASHPVPKQWPKRDPSRMPRNDICTAPQPLIGPTHDPPKEKTLPLPIICCQLLSQHRQPTHSIPDLMPSPSGPHGVRSSKSARSHSGPLDATDTHHLLMEGRGGGGQPMRTAGISTVVN